MSDNLTRINEYENRLLEDRAILQKLIEENNADTSERNYFLIKDKLDHFSEELAYMNRQVNFLKHNFANEYTNMQQNTAKVQNNFNSHENNVAPVTNAAPVNNYVPPHTNPNTNPAPNINPNINPNGNNYIPPQRSNPAFNIQRPNIEKAIGKSLMGIFASVLIFISIILLATLLLPYLNDASKITISFVISFAFTIVGLFLMKKDADNKFYIALAACGIGAIYISMLLCNMYFKVIGDITLYVLITIWGVGICLLSKLQNRLFEIIGHIGILISVMFGCLLCIAHDDEVKFCVLIIYYLITSLIFYLVHCKKELQENIIFHSFNLANSFMLTFASLILLNVADTFNLIAVMLICIPAVYVAMLIYSDADFAPISFCVFTTGNLLVLFFALDRAFYEFPTLYGVISYIIAAALLFLINRKDFDNNVAKYIPQGFLLLMCVFAADSLPVTSCYVLMILVALPALAFGYIFKNEVCKYGTIAVVFIMCFDAVQEAEYFICGLIIIAACLFCVRTFKEQYSLAFKYWCYGMSVFFIMLLLPDTLNTLFDPIGITYSVISTITYLTLVIYNFAMVFSCFGKNMETGEDEKHSLYNIVNIILMPTGLFLMNETSDIFLQFLIIIAAIATFMLNAKRLLDKRNNIFYGIYVGLKFVVLLYSILASFNAVNYLVSISFFIFAIICIMAGFRFDYKSLRIFGLVLSMISTFKLVMVDITYSNTLGHAVSFFVSGILCFVISLIYNYIDKNFAWDKSDDDL